MVHGAKVMESEGTPACFTSIYIYWYSRSILQYTTSTPDWSCI